MDGRATFTIAMSSTTMNCTASRTASPNHLVFPTAATLSVLSSPCGRPETTVWRAELETPKARSGQGGCAVSPTGVRQYGLPYLRRARDPGRCSHRRLATLQDLLLICKFLLCRRQQ